MKQLAFFLLLFSLHFALPAQTPDEKISRKELRQRARIAEGRASGELTPREARKLRRQQRRIHQRKERAGADGQLSPGEQRRIDRAQRRASRNIYRKKHNARQR